MDITKSGYVYVLQMEGHPYYKIGRTVNITRRLGEISPQMPSRAVVVMAHRVVDAWRTESMLHGNYKQKRLNGEWFRLEENDLREIKAGLMSDQGNRLYDKLLALIVSDVYHELNHVRLTRALHHATIRMDRRYAAYFDSFILQTDPVLEAEIIG